MRTMYDEPLFTYLSTGLNVLNPSGELFHIGRITYFVKCGIFKRGPAVNSTFRRLAVTEDYFLIPGSEEVCGLF